MALKISSATQAAFAVSTTASRLLLDRGADPNVTDNQGVTPLQVARQYDRADVMELLRRAGARK